MNATKIAIIVLALVIIGAVIFFFATQKSSAPTTNESQNQTETIQEEPAADNTQQETDANAVVVNISGKNFEFSQDTIELKKGQTVTVNFTSEDGFHDWVVDEFNAATSQVNTGESSSVTFVADKVGEFEYYCSVMQHRQMGMVGQLIVTD